MISVDDDDNADTKSSAPFGVTVESVATNKIITDTTDAETKQPSNSPEFTTPKKVRVYSYDARSAGSPGTLRRLFSMDSRPAHASPVGSPDHHPERLTSEPSGNFRMDSLLMQSRPKPVRTTTLYQRMKLGNYALTEETEIDRRDFDLLKITPREDPFSRLYGLSKLTTAISEYDDKIDLENIKDTKFLCQGSHCDLLTGVFNDKCVIVKVVKDEFSTSKIALDECEREISILCKLSHPHILALYASGKSKNKLAQTSKKFIPSSVPLPIMVLEYLQGNTLKYHITLRRSFHDVPFTIPRVIRIAKEFADALNYLHFKFSDTSVLIHRDLKPDNIGFTADGVLKLLDFGLCVSLKRDTTEPASYELSGCTGSLRYMAPEVALNKKYNEKVDMYSFAVIMYEAVTGVTPFTGLKKEEFYKKVINEGLRPKFDYDDYGRRVRMPLELEDLIAEGWNCDPSERPTSAHALEVLTALDKEMTLQEENTPDILRFFSCLCQKRNSI